MQQHRSGRSWTVGLATLAWLLALGFIADVAAQVHVKGYTKKDGTYVAPYVRSAPNKSTADNYSAQGNYNPYSGKAGTVNPYPANSYPAIPANHPALAYAASSSLQHTSAYPPAAQAPRPQIYYVYRCVAASGLVSYISQPRAGCDELLVRLPAVATAPARQLASYGGYPCSGNCSGHDAGYQWASDKEIEDPDDCGGNSQSFIEGCRSYGQERQDQAAAEFEE